MSGDRTCTLSGGMPSLFASNVEDLALSNVEFQRPTPLPEGWNEEAVVVNEGSPAVWS